MVEESDQVLADYFRCDVGPVRRLPGPLSPEPGYFTFCGTVGFGHLTGFTPAVLASDRVPEVGETGEWRDGCLWLPFDLQEAVDNLRYERYRRSPRGLAERLTSGGLLRRAYYTARPLLPVGLRRHLQKLRFSGWRTIPFPEWPLDLSADRLVQHALRLTLERSGVGRVPFVWFWPDGHSACAMMTHDVEGPPGRVFCDELMGIDEAYGIPAAFQVVPDGPAATSAAEIARLRARGFEVNVHDLNHDGSLFADRRTFQAKAGAVNAYAAQLGCRGFRSGAMYREQEWFDAFDFDYDMSVPNAAHLEPQRGGCCTIMPYFIGRVLELPLTTTQDYSLFHILGDYSTREWRRQLDVIVGNHGLASFIAHPDYLIEPRARRVYEELLAILAELRDKQGVWTALPGEIDRWFRDRRGLRLVRQGSSWRVVGSGSERARVAYATLHDGRLAYELAA
jgi:hypothetical protein